MAGIVTIVWQTVGYFFKFFRFCAHLACCDQETWATVRIYMSPITTEQKREVHISKNKVAAKFRPTRLKLGDGLNRLAEMGERGGQLYSVPNTTVHDIGEFGLGIGAQLLSSRKP